MMARSVARSIGGAAGGGRATAPARLGVELLTAGDFSQSAIWGPGAGWTISGGVAVKTPGSSSNIAQTIPLGAGGSYRISIDVTARVAGSISPRLVGGTTVAGAAISAVGTNVQTLVAVDGNTDIRFLADATFDGTVDNASVKRVFY